MMEFTVIFSFRGKWMPLKLFYLQFLNILNTVFVTCFITIKLSVLILIHACFFLNYHNVNKIILNCIVKHAIACNFNYSLLNLLSENTDSSIYFQVPENKTMLQDMMAKEEAFLFHNNVCKKCHSIPNLTEWIETNETDGIDVFITGKREGLQKIWEPFFVCTHKEPLWDERLNWEGQGNKMCQVCKTHN